MLNALNRLRITRKNIADAIKYRKSRKGTPPYLIKWVPNLRVKGKKVYADRYELVAAEDREKILKQSVYDKGSTTHSVEIRYFTRSPKKT